MEWGRAAGGSSCWKVKSWGFHVLVMSLPTQIQDAQDAYIPQIIDAFAASSIFYLVVLNCLWTYWTFSYSHTHVYMYLHMYNVIIDSYLSLLSPPFHFTGVKGYGSCPLQLKIISNTYHQCNFLAIKLQAFASSQSPPLVINTSCCHTSHLLYCTRSGSGPHLVVGHSVFFRMSVYC